MSEPSTNPFPGLRPFKFHEHELFFGREEQYEQMVNKLSSTRFLAVVGTSGSGKSSLVRAGMLPALYGGLMSSGSNWRVALFRPKDDPIHELALALNHRRVFGGEFKENGSSLLSIAEIKDLSGLCSRLRSEDGKELPDLGSRILNFLPQDMRQIILNAEQNKDCLQVSKSEFVKVFNNILKNRDFYQEQDFQKIAVNGCDSQALLNRGRENLSDSEIQGLNRLLLEAYYPKEIAKNGEFQTQVTEVTLRRGDLGLIDAVRRAKMPEGENLLIVVDQFEELFRYARISENGPHGNQAAAFVKLLLRAKSQKETPIYVVLTMRSDYLGDCAKFWDLPEAINEGQYLIPRLTREQRREAIRGPIKTRGVNITPQLVNQLLTDMGDDPDQLPILQHALMRTWDNWEKNHQENEPIDIRHYVAIGRMDEALSRHAEEAYSELPDERSRKVAEKLFKCLTEKEAGERETRRPTEVREIHAITKERFEEIVNVINVFRAEGRSFLMPSPRKSLTRKTLIDISHESLIRNWKRLKDWVGEEAQAASDYRRLAETANFYKNRRTGFLPDYEVEYDLEWREKNRPNRAWASRYHPYLNDVTQKAYGEATTQKSKKTRDRKIFDDAITFLEDSRRERAEAKENTERQRKRQLLRARVIAAILLAAVILFIYFWREEGRKEKLANLLAYAVNINNAQKTYDEENFASAYELLNTLSNQKYDEVRGLEFDVLTRPSANYLNKLTHSDEVLSVAFLPEGESLASMCADGRVQLWDTNTWKTKWWKVSASEESSNPVSFATFSRDGKMLATVNSSHKTIKLWDTKTQKELPLAGINDGSENKVNIQSVAFSPDGKMLVSASGANTIHRWNTSTGEILQSIKGTPETIFITLAFAKDGKLAIGSVDGKVWLLEANALIPQMMIPPKIKISISNSPQMETSGSKDPNARVSMTAMTFSPDTKTLVSGDSQGSIMLWDTSTREGLMGLHGHSSFITSMEISPEGNILATASHNGDVKLWDMNTLKDPNTWKDMTTGDKRATQQELANTLNQLATILTGHAGAVSSMAFVPDKNIIATASADKTIRLWKTTLTKTTQLKRLQLNPPDAVSFVAFSPDEKTFATVSRHGTVQLHVRNSDNSISSDGIADTTNIPPVSSVAFSPDKKSLAAYGYDGSIKLWDISSSKETIIIRAGHPLSAYGSTIAFSPDGEILAAWSPDEGIILHNTITGAEKITPLKDSHGAIARSVAFSPDLKILAIGREDGTTCLLSTSTGQELRALEGHVASVMTVAFSHDGKRLATGSEDKTVNLWNINTGIKLTQLKGHTEPVTSVAFSKDDRRLATGSWDGTMKLWDIDERHWDLSEEIRDITKRYELITLRSPDGAVLAVAFSTDGKTLAIASANGIDSTVRLW